MTSVLEDLTHVRRERAYLKTREAALVAQARRDGHSWATIGRALGITKQACQRTFGGPRPDVESLPLSDPLFDPLFSSKQE